MSIAHGHFYVVMTQDFLERKDVSAGHHKMRCKRMAQNMSKLPAWKCKHTRFSSTHFLRFPGFQPSVGTLPVSGYSGIRGGARRYIQPASAL